MNKRFCHNLPLLATLVWLLVSREPLVAGDPPNDAVGQSPQVSEGAPDVFDRLPESVRTPGEPLHLSPRGNSFSAGPLFESISLYDHSEESSSCGTAAPMSVPPEYCHFYVRAEYLAWWFTGDSLPPLVTTSPASTPRPQAGVLGEPTTSVLFGDETVSDGLNSGARFVFGMCVSPTARIEGEWFGFGSQTTSFSSASDGSTILARPFFNLVTDAQDANIVAYPNQLAGTINASVSSQLMGAGIHASYLLNYCESCDRYTRLDFLYGFRYLGFYERLGINSSATSIDPFSPIPVGTTLDLSDRFSASSNFFGANLGAMVERRTGRWYLTAVGWLGIGGTSQQVAINGSTTVTQPDGDSDESDGGLLALPTNIGKYNESQFTVVPQLELKAAYLLSPNLRLTVGYDLIYWSNVVRAADQVDLNVNPSQSGDEPLIGPAGPLFTMHQSDLFIHGISTGLEWRY